MIEIFESELSEKKYLLKRYVKYLIFFSIVFSFLQLFLILTTDYGFTIDKIFQILTILLIIILPTLIYYFQKQITAIRLNIEEGILEIDYLNLWNTLWCEDFKIDGNITVFCNFALNNPNGKYTFIIKTSNKSITYIINEQMTGWTKETLEALIVRLVILQRTNEKFLKLKITMNNNYKGYIEGKINELGKNK